MPIPKSKPRSILGFASGCALLVAACFNWTIRQGAAGEDEQSSPLRSALKQNLLLPRHENSFKGGFGGNDVTPTVKRFIQLGMSFDEATQILRAAGFTVKYPDLKRESSDPNRSKDWYVVVGSARRFIPKFLGCINVYISLLPASPGDYTIVRGIQGTAFNRTL